MIRAIILTLSLIAFYDFANVWAHENGDPNAAYYQSLQRPEAHYGGSCCDGPHVASEMGTVPDCFPVPMQVGPKGYEFFFDKGPVWRDYAGLDGSGYIPGDHTLLEQGSRGKGWWVVPDDVVLHREAPPDGEATACIHYGTLLCFNAGPVT